MRVRHLWVLAVMITAIPPALADSSTHDPNRSIYRAPYAQVSPTVDGLPDDQAWRFANWRAVKERWLGPAYTPDDFSGRYKVVWTENHLHILFELTDDIIIDRYRNPLIRYWDDDTLEIFIDEDHSGGNHQYNHNAFAYHISLDNQAIDLGTDSKPRSYTHHVESRWKQNGDLIHWEVNIQVYSDSYNDDGQDNSPVKLHRGKVMGFLLAYCDNDGSEIRENFIGSEIAEGPSPDRGWIDAGLFGTLELVD